MTRLLSLPMAILVNINIMLGSGIFINSIPLTHAAGALGALTYPLVGLLIFPLVAAFSYLLAYYPGGTFYELGATVNPFWGFLSGWGYFIGKLGSASVGVHVFVTIMQQFSPALQGYSPLLLDTIIIGIFTLLISFNLKTGRPVQYAFIILKSIPITIALYAALRLFDTSSFTPESVVWSGLPACISLGVFAFAGFEASCSLSKNIKNSQRNGPLAIMISYAIVLVTVTLFQFGLFGILGIKLGAMGSFQEPFAYALAQLFGSGTSLATLFTHLAYIGIASSALGASYGILYSNVWNLQVLANNGHVPYGWFFQKQNAYYAPYTCVFVGALAMLGYLAMSQLLIRGTVAQQLIPLQQIAAISSTLAYTISVFAFLKLSFVLKKAPRFLAVLSALSCCVLYIATLANAQKFGFFAYGIYGAALLFGILFLYNAQATRKCSGCTQVS